MDDVTGPGTDGVPLGWWTTVDALLWAERTHAPVHLTGRPFTVWEQAGRDEHGPTADDPVVARLHTLGLLGPPPAPRIAGASADEVVVTMDGGPPVAIGRDEVADWPGASPADTPLVRCRRTPAGWVVSHAGNDVPVAFEPRLPEARVAAATLGRALATATSPSLWVPMVAVERDHDVLLVAAGLLTDPLVRAGCGAHGHVPATAMAAVTGIRPQVTSALDPRRHLPVAGLVLDRSWSALDPMATPLLARWIVACLLAAANAPTAAGRYALLDTARRLADQAVVLLPLDDARALPGLLATAPAAG